MNPPLSLSKIYHFTLYYVYSLNYLLYSLQQNHIYLPTPNYYYYLNIYSYIYLPYLIAHTQNMVTSPSIYLAISPYVINYGLSPLMVPLFPKEISQANSYLYHSLSISKISFLPLSSPSISYSSSIIYSSHSYSYTPLMSS